MNRFLTLRTTHTLVSIFRAAHAQVTLNTSEGKIFSAEAPEFAEVVVKETAAYDPSVRCDLLDGFEASFPAHGIFSRLCFHTPIVLFVPFRDGLKSNLFCVEQKKLANDATDMKEATLDNGRKILVPHYLNPGDKIKIRTTNETFHSNLRS